MFLKLVMWGLLLFSFVAVRAQFWIAGTPGDFVSIELEQSFDPGVSVLMDIDCDGQADLTIKSFQGTQSNPWNRLSIHKAADVEVLNSGVGLVTTFEQGDTVFFDNDLWTTALDFLYGVGELGCYGHPFIDNKFLAFRKNLPDTSYCFVRFSSQTIHFTIHEIISNCEINPVEVITSLSKTEDSCSPFVFPNPFSNKVNILFPELQQARVLNLKW
jgi:hypothetical protein